MLGPGEPPVPFTVPLLDIEPAAVLPEPVLPPEAPEPPPPACASAEVLVKTNAATKRNLEDLIVDSYAAKEQTPQFDLVPNRTGFRSSWTESSS